ncbi:MAG: type II toxin-antitoxin system RelE/ParE family toxin [Gammaproteobacteria bacterium]|nr:type II toxin-antitoxin system RelE/ParE family toxin [Gammaproteobacteria bacterium]
MDKCPVKRISVKFYCLVSGKEPVLIWLKSLLKADRKIIGVDIKTVEEGWPLGMPLVEKLERNLWEVRCDITNNCIARVFFTVVKHDMVLLHGIKKKTQKIPLKDLRLAKKRRDTVLNTK